MKKIFEKIKKYIRRESTGLSMVETLVAITILLVSIAAPMTMAHQGLQAAQRVKSQITASYLAQDVIEYIRNTRDENILAGRNWRNGLAQCIGSSCIIDVPNDNIEACGGTCEKVRNQASSGLYGHNSGWAETKFTRMITMSNINNDESQIVVVVSWDEGSSTESITVIENILNWSED